MQIIHCYAPTSKSDDESIEKLYEDIEQARKLENTYYTIITGDFNAKIGEKQQHDSEYIGNFGLGQRNDRGNMLVNFLNDQKLYCLNTFFKKQPQRKWTWCSPDKRVKNEIDYIFSNTRTICKDVSVLNRFNTGSDHRLVRTNIVINTKYERQKLIHKTHFPTTDTLIQKQNQYQQELQNKLGPIQNLHEKGIDELAEKITKDIQIATRKICANVKSQKQTKFSQDTMRLIEERSM